jgi:hypothetical protein
MTRSVLLLALVAACGPKPGGDVPAHPTESGGESTGRVWVSEALGVKDGRVAGALEAPFESPVPVSNSAKVSAEVTDCQGYFRLKAEGYAAVSEENHSLLRSEGVRCETLKRIEGMHPGTGEPAKAFLSDRGLAQHLPATVGPSVSDDERLLREQSAAQGQAWSAYASPTSTELTGSGVVVSEPDTTSRLRPLASGDLNHDGIAELLVEAVCSGTEGSWVDVRLLVLTPVAADGGAVSFSLLETVRP